MRFVVSLSLLVLLLAAPVASQAPRDLLIVPGVRIGRWTLEMSIDDLVRMNGPAFITRLEAPDVVSALQRYVWSAFGGPEKLEAVSSDGKKVVWLSVSGVKFKTDMGIGPLSQRSAVETAYGKPTAEIAQRGGATTPLTNELVQNVVNLAKGPVEFKVFRGWSWMIYDRLGLGLGIFLGTITFGTTSLDDPVARILVFSPGTAKSIWRF